MSSLELVVNKAVTLEWHPGAFHSSKLPNLYVKVYHNEHRILKTQALGRSGNPIWNTSLQFISTAPSDILAFRLFHNSRGPNMCIGEASASVQNLIERSSSEQDVCLYINVSRGKFQLHVSVKVLTAQEAVTQMTEDISKLTISSTTGKIMATIETVEGVSSGANFLQSFKAVLSALENIVKVGDELAKIHPYANAAWKILTSIYTITKHQQEMDEKVVKLVEAMANLYSFATEADLVVKKSKNVEESVQNIAKQTLECALFLREYLENGFFMRSVQNALPHTRERIEKMTDTLLKLKQDFDLGITLQTTLMTAQILDKVQTLETQRILAQLRHVKSASLVPRECLAGTRINILGDITEQLMTVSKTPIIWLSGVAGSGKSTIATSISQYFRALGRLGAVIRFARNDVGHSNPIMVLHSIVLGLANAHPDIEQAICKVLAHDYQLLDAAIESQFQELLLGPLDSVKQHIVGPFIVIIDAVDECATNFREDMINLIAKLFPKLPTAIRLLVTARPDADITSGFGNASTIYQHRLTTEPEDISLYIHNRLDIIRQKHNLDSWWPGKDRVTHLVSLSGNLFIWAVTALNFVGERTAFYPPKRLDTLLHTPFREDNLNQLYTLALESNGDWNDLEFKESATLILATIALSKLSLTDRAIDSILGFTNDFTARVLRHFGAVIEWSPEQPAQILHASFGDFLLHPSDKTNPWFFEIAEANKILTSGCLTLLQKCLRFNIYDFPDSHLLNSEVPGLGESPLPVGLIYASRFWGSHLGNTKYDGKIVELLEGFLRNKFLFWLEIVSVQQEISSAESTLMLAQKYIHGKYQTIEMFLQDARKFISVFAPVISQSAPHIYVSALPLTPRDSVVRQYFLSLFPHLLQYTVPNSWVKLEKVLWGHTDKVTCVALSPNGELIVSGSHDHALRMWEASSGAPVGNPLQGPTRPVISLAFSADGQYIISVTDDRTVQIWDARSRAPIGDPLPGCTGYVNCVAFSPDGQHIVSASFHDQTMQIWDTSSGAPIGNPLQGHTEYVSCVAFSPDGQRIVSASHDKTVQIWDASSGAPIGNPLQGHTGEVSSVAFSPDGQQIASGSWDTTVRIWDASSGAPIGNPLQGHTDIVYCVAFSPDGQQIVSGSWDTTVRIWDTHSGAPIGGPLQGHTGWVYVVAFSPDGQHIVSGSDDKTVQIWDADTSAPLGDPLQGHLAHAEDVEFSTNGQHILSLSDNKTMQIWDTSSGAPVGHPLHPLRNRTGWVTSVALSPNGQCIAFGLNDHTVRIWETSTGTPLTRPLKGHTQSVTSIAFSPDGQRIVSGSWDKILRIWDPSIGGAVGHPLKGHTDSVSSVAFSPDGQCIVSGSDDKTVRIWDASSGAPIGDPLKGHTSSVTSVAFSPDGQQIISGSRDRTVRIWDAGTCAPIGDPLLGCTESVSCVAFSPDGQHIVSGSGDKVRIWDTHTGACIGVPFQGHTAFIGCVTFLPDGQHIVSGSTDGIVRIWDACIGASKPDDHMSELSVHLLPKHPDTFEDGWISSAAGRLIWVPCFLQSNFCLPWCKFVITPHGVMALDLSKFVHGTEWAKCMEAYQ